MRDIIFIGGIHGSGKGTICEKIISEFDIVHLTASEVLKWTDFKNQTEKTVDNISDTQEKLIYNLNNIIRKSITYLLDGHYCLINKSGKPEKIPIETFIKISPKKLLLIITEPMEIKSRLEKRDSKFYDLEFIQNFQTIEVNHSKEISEKLELPLLIFDSLTDNYENLINFIR